MVHLNLKDLHIQHKFIYVEPLWALHYTIYIVLYYSIFRLWLKLTTIYS